jgi:hypothetical protein
MRMGIFKRMVAIEEEKEMDKLDIGDYFLYGKSIIAQKETKKAGHPITYYQVIGKSHGRVEYTPIYDYMEKDKGEEIK